jgi:hypothetical protein
MTSVVERPLARFRDMVDPHVRRTPAPRHGLPLAQYDINEGTIPGVVTRGYSLYSFVTSAPREVRLVKLLRCAVRLMG